MYINCLNYLLFVYKSYLLDTYKSYIYKSFIIDTNINIKLCFLLLYRHFLIGGCMISSIRFVRDYLQIAEDLRNAICFGFKSRFLLLLIKVI